MNLGDVASLPPTLSTKQAAEVWGVSPTAEDLMYQAWAVIANVSEGDWTQQDPRWVAAAERWRDQWHATLPRSETP